MTEQEQQGAFNEELNRLIDRYCDEFEMTYASFVGILTIKATEMTNQSAQYVDEDDAGN